MSKFGEDAPVKDPDRRKGWGENLPRRGRSIARRLTVVANVTFPLSQRKEEAVILASGLMLTPHMAWRLACDAAIRLGYGPRGSDMRRQLIEHRPPGGAWPSAEAWLRAAGLDDEGRWAP